jgi:TRAP-type C4-dicarboxylate transport system substrate-binding protein
MTSFFKKSLIASSVLAVSISAHAVAKDYKLASTAPAGTIWTQHLDKWAKDVTDKSGGDLTVNGFHGGTLGNEGDLLKKTRQGRVEFMAASNAALSTLIPEMGLFAMPFMFRSYAEVDCVRDSEFGKKVTDKLNDVGLQFVSGSEVGMVHYFGDKDFSDVGELEGYKMYTYPTPQSKVAADAFGIVGVTMPFADVASALQTGLVDGGASPIIAFLAFGLYESAPHLTKVNIGHVGGSFIVNKKLWDSFSDEKKELLKNAGVPEAEARKQIRAMMDGMEKKYASKGGPVHIPTDEQVDAFFAKFEPSRQAYLEAMGGEAAKLYPEMVETLKVCRQK